MLGQPFGAPIMDHRAPIPSVANYVPQQPMPLTLRPVVTPGNNPELFRQRAALAKTQNEPKPQILPQQLLRGTLAPTQMSGPNIYIRCLNGLRSKIPEEEDFALHHLVKVSYERGDKFKFEGFPLLAEALIEKALEITELLYNTTWELSYDPSDKPNVLNGSFGTPNLLQRIEYLKAQATKPGVESADYLSKLEKVTEAIVVIRNMCWLDDNAKFVSEIIYFREFLVIALNLPKVSDISEYEHCALKICEDVTPFLAMTVHDPLFQSLIRYIESDDRGHILAATKAIDYISGDLAQTNKVTGLSPSLITRLLSFTVLPDEELQFRALRLLYQYTSHPENLRDIFTTSPFLLEQAVPKLVDNLMYDAREVEIKELVQPEIRLPPNTVIPTIPTELLKQLINIPESDRSKYWLRSCFEEDADSDITQIAIWQAYQAQFSQHNPLAASEFIKNVSVTFGTAQAQVIPPPAAAPGEPQGPPKFIIKGIRPRRTPVDLSGNRLQKCYWEIPSIDPTKPERRPCGTYHLTRQTLWNHVLLSHLHFQRDESGMFPFTQAPPEGYKCGWPGCTKAPLTNSRAIATHVKIHMPEDKSLKAASTSLQDFRKSALDGNATKANEDIVKEAVYSVTKYYDSPLDEYGRIYGIAAESMGILQNMARNTNKLVAQEKATASVPGGGLGMEEKSFIGTIELMFPESVKHQLAYVLAHNRNMGKQVATLMGLIDKGETTYRGLVDKHEHQDEDGMIF